MPNVSLKKVLLKSAPTEGRKEPSLVVSVNEPKARACKPGWSNGLGNLIFTVAPTAPEEMLKSGVLSTSTSPTKSAPTEEKSNERPAAEACGRPSIRGS